MIYCKTKLKQREICEKKQVKYNAAPQDLLIICMQHDIDDHSYITLSPFTSFLNWTKAKEYRYIVIDRFAYYRPRCCIKYSSVCTMMSKKLLILLRGSFSSVHPRYTSVWIFPHSCIDFIFSLSHFSMEYIYIFEQHVIGCFHLKVCLKTIPTVWPRFL